MRIKPLALTLACLGACAIAPAPARSEPPPEASEFFEARVRPLLVESCVRCHGPKKQAGGLRLDSREAILEGGENGPAVVPGQPGASLLIQAVRYAHESIKMPPKTPLPAESVAALSRWVEQGAAWPKGVVPTGPEVAQSAAAHWAFRPVRASEPPTVKDPSWVTSPIDAYILAKLEAAGIAPSPPADKRTLIRRATFDLIGLPPTAEEVDAFLADAAPEAFDRVVERLLASPHYGERWGRFWLDIARYADTKGYVFQEERRYPYAYTYRDYVVRAFNEDRPYDRFLVEQIAADRLPPGDDPRALAALGFLTVGRRFLNNGDDIIDDRIDVVTRGLLGLSVVCARCHDQKFDPIPTDDYYSLHGVFASSIEPKELPTIAEPTPSASARDFDRQLQARQSRRQDYLNARRAEIEADLRTRAGTVFLAAFDLDFNPGHPKFDERARADKIAPSRLRFALRRWKEALAAPSSGNQPAFADWPAYAALPSGEFAARVKSGTGFAAGVPSKATLPPLLRALLTQTPPLSLREVAARHADWLALAPLADPIRAAWGGGIALGTDPDGLAWCRLAFAADGPASVSEEALARVLDKAERNALTALTRQVEALAASHPGAPERAMVLNDAPNPVNPFVFVRGNRGRRGKDVPRRFLAVLSGPDRKPFQEGSGRLELARAIASPDNPLTARVLVNRVWMHHFGTGLVATPSDFGVRSDPPSHPELLDALAAGFMQGGWSIKALHRTIMKSSVYRQRSDDNPTARTRDPENRLLGRFPRHRLDFEALRDSVLAVAGTLDPTVGGRPVPLADSTRRTIYGFIDRQNLDGVYRTFDFASPDASTPRRFVTTVPQQALYLMNSPFLLDQARRLAGAVVDSSDEARVRHLYRQIFARAPEAHEVAAGLRFLRAESDSTDPGPGPYWQCGVGTFDESSGRVDSFRALPHWTGTAWQCGPSLPDPKEGHLHWTATGGHADRDPSRVAIRRWRAPRALTIAVDGTLGHPNAGGDGVRGRIVAGRGGVLGEWVAHHGKAETTVARYEIGRGETLDFLVDCRANDNSDSFAWAPEVRELAPHPERWSVQAEFTGPGPTPLAPWELYAQVLLLTNEFAFVD